MKRPRIEIEHVEPHKFKVGNSTMVGSVINIRLGVRCISVEAGWVRSPGDGIMRGGTLANAAIRHFGIPKARTDLKLVHSDTFPRWIDDQDRPISAHDIAPHLVLLDD